ncbi:MAG: ATP-grasp domain-containing protein [Deltaproteobacteria bacterium]|nr:ATP-grasp domain-containing protein [Deltaproteobacteria bacterium]
MCNVLLTCAGRRNYLVEYFRKALAGRGEIFAADVSPYAPALQEADRAFLVPPFNHEDYLPALLGICREFGVRLLFSLSDLELPALARVRGRFSEVGTLAVVSSPEVVDICFDKLSTNRFLAGITIDTPKTWTTLAEAQAAMAAGDLKFPVAIKPRWGSASIGNEYPENFEELELASRLGRIRIMRSSLRAVSSGDEERCLLIQEKLAGEEYNLDVINDFQGRYVTTLVKRKLAMRVGEGAVLAASVENPTLEALGRLIGEKLGHVGNLDCDVFVDGDRYCVIDLNPRFGGTYPFSHAAGADLPAAFIAWAQGQPIDPRWLTLKPAIMTAKCDRVVEVVAERALKPAPHPEQPESSVTQHREEPLSGQVI